MSEPVSALPGASFEGAVDVREAGLCGMISLRGDLSNKKLVNAVEKLPGVAVPGVGEINLNGAHGAGWMSPDELLILTPYGDVTDSLASLSASLKGTHHLLSNISDARAVFTLKGAHCREVLAKLSPADLSVRGFNAGQLRRTRLAQVPAAFWFSDTDQITLVCFRSVAGYVFTLLKNAADPAAVVGHF